MKKSFLTIALAFTIANLGAQIQIIEKISSYNSWSIAADVGLNHFNGDLMASFPQRFNGVLLSPNVNVNIEHNIDPSFVLGWEFGFTTFNQQGERPRGTGNGDEIIYFQSFSSSPYVGVNLMNITREGRLSKWGVWAKVGLGFAGYARQFTSMRNPSTNVIDTIVDFRSRNQERIKNRIMAAGSGLRATEISLYVPLSLTLEYAISNNISIGAYGKFVVTNSDYLESISRHKNVDYWQSGGISIRYKFTRPDTEHYRNTLYGEGVKSNTELISLLRRDLDALNDRLGDCDCRNIDSLNRRIRELERQVPDPNIPHFDRRLQELENRKVVEPQPVRRDTVVVLERAVVPAESALPPIPTFRPSIFFDFDRTDIDSDGHLNIRKAAEILRADPTLLVEIRGFTDKPGSGSYNQRLSERRSEGVKRVLVQMHGIDPNRITTNGKGQIPEPPTATRFNRRCDIIFYR